MPPQQAKPRPLCASKDRQPSMTKTIIIFSFFLTTVVSAQLTNKNSFKKVEGLTSIDSVTWQDIAAGFYIQPGICGYYFRLDSCSTFKKIDFCCNGNTILDSGYWFLIKKNRIVLKSKTKTLKFDIVKYDAFYFFILPNQRTKFLNDLRLTKDIFKNAKSTTIEGKLITKEYMVAYYLTKKYYAEEIITNTGT